MKISVHNCHLLFLSIISLLPLLQLVSCVPIDVEDLNDGNAFDDDGWRPSMADRSLEPHFKPKNYHHDVPKMRVIDGDNVILLRLEQLKVFMSLGN